ncbi:Protein of unknown function [Gryllus bimaculatus]|nr:Protein of unknown function [Gryllus bimaculatus]
MVVKTPVWRSPVPDAEGPTRRARRRDGRRVVLSVPDSGVGSAQHTMVPFTPPKEGKIGGTKAGS